MDQRGYIVEIVNERTAKFKMKRESAWAKCGKCFSSKTSSESQDLVVEVDNTLGAQLGDYVEVSMEKVNVMKALAIMYGVPLIALLLGTVGGYYLLKSTVGGDMLEVYSMLIGLVFTALAYLGIRFKDGKLRDSREYMPVVTRIMIDLNTTENK